MLLPQANIMPSRDFYLKYPNAEIIKVEPLQTPDSFEQIVIEDGFEILGKED